MTFRTLMGSTRKNSSFCLVCWPEEDNTLSIVPMKKVLSPSTDDLTPDTFCKVKGLEKHLCKVVAIGTEAEMKTKMEELDNSADAVAEPPPRKKVCARKEATQKAKKGKENKTAPSTRKKANQPGRIILVGASEAPPQSQPKPPVSSADPPKEPGPSQSQPQPTVSPTNPPKEPGPSQSQPKPTDSPKEPGPSQSQPKPTVSPTDPPKEPGPSQEQPNLSVIATGPLPSMSIAADVGFSQDPNQEWENFDDIFLYQTPNNCAVTNKENMRSPEDDGKTLIQAVYLNNHTYTIIDYTEKGLSLHLVVDDNCKRL